MDPKSSYSLIEQGYPTEKDSINIVFEEYKVKDIQDLLSKSGYFKTQKNHLVCKKDEELSLIHKNDVLYIEGVNNDTYVHTIDNEYTIKQKLYELEITLQEDLFVRISKSYIASINHINKIKPTFNGKLLLVLDNGVKLEVTRHYIHNFRKILGM